MIIVDERTWTYKLFLKGLDALEITEVLQYMNTEEGCRLCGYFSDYPDFGRYFLKVSDSVLGFSLVNKEFLEEKFALSRFLELGAALLRVYFYNNKQRGDVPPLRIVDQSNVSISVEGGYVEKLASGVMYKEVEIPEGTFVSGLYTLYVGEGVREIDVRYRDWETLL